LWVLLEPIVSAVSEATLLFATRAAEFSDRKNFDLRDAATVLYGAIQPFHGAHVGSMWVRLQMFEAINLALSSLPGNQASVRCVERTDGYTVQWLPYELHQVRD
jgi:hypothetical protein